MSQQNRKDNDLRKDPDAAVSESRRQLDHDKKDCLRLIARNYDTPHGFPASTSSSFFIARQQRGRRDVLLLSICDYCSVLSTVSKRLPGWHGGR
jgi:hypothetical protein